MGRELSYKKSLLVIYKISELFPNTLSADGKYSLLDRGNLTQHIQIIVSRKQKTFSSFFSSFLKSSLNLEHFQKKMTLMLMYFRNYGVQNTWLDQCLKSPVSKHPSKSNMVNAPKHCSNLKSRSFTIFTDHGEINCLTKSVC